MTKPTLDASNASPRQYCALAYAGPEPSDASSSDEQRVVVIFLLGKPVPSILLNPDWRAILPQSEWNYFQDLLFDWRQQAATRPEELFRQLSALNTGPLITHRVGRDLASDPKLSELASRFETLW